MIPVVAVGEASDQALAAKIAALAALQSGFVVLLLLGYRHLSNCEDGAICRSEWNISGLCRLTKAWPVPAGQT